MTATILLIRHGLTDWNVARLWQGHTDIPLNEMGRAQAQALARRLAGWPIQAIYSSDLKRAAATAQAIGDVVGQDPIYDLDWRERDVGLFSGLTGSQAQARFPQVWANGQPGMVDPPEGERHVDLRARAIAAFAQVCARHQGEMVAVVSHGGVLHTLIAHLIGIPAGRYGRFTMRGNTGLSIIEMGDHGPVVTLLNDTSHLTQLSSEGERLEIGD